MPSKPYGLICPISKACEYLEPRWTIQILTELWCGSSRFNDIRRGIGHISPALLSRRLKEMEVAGLVERVEDRATGNIDYLRTAKAIALEPALTALSDWAQRNIEAEVAVREPNLSALMWKTRRLLDVGELPPRRVVMRFHFANVTSDYDCYWVVAQPGTEVEICSYDRKTDVDLYVETSAASLAAIMLWRTTVAREIAEGRLFLSGDPRLIRTIGSWLPRGDYKGLAGIVPLKPVQHAVCRVAS